MTEELRKERDQLLTTVEGLRDKLSKATATQQDIETQRQTALDSICQVSMGQILIDRKLTNL